MPDLTASFQRTGEGWSERDWLAKALEMISGEQIPRTFGAGRPPLAAAAQSSCCLGLLQQTGGVEIDIVDGIEKHGLDVLPDWFSPLDRIYEVQDMAEFQAQPEAMMASFQSLGEKGKGYVVPKMPRYAPKRQLGRQFPPELLKEARAQLGAQPQSA